MKREFTGRHMVLTLVAFFGVVMAVNFTMARLAVRDFSGTVVDNSYIASQHYNDWIAIADEQAEKGWQATATLDEDVHVVLALEGLAADSIEAVAENPLRRSDDIALTMERQADGTYRSIDPLPEGRWAIRTVVTGKDGTGRFLHHIRV